MHDQDVYVTVTNGVVWIMVVQTKCVKSVDFKTRS